MASISTNKVINPKYCNPRSKTKQRRQQRRESAQNIRELTAEIVQLGSDQLTKDVKTTPTSDEVVKDLNRDKSIRTEPSKLMPEKPLSSKIVGAVGKNRTSYGSKPPHGMPHRSALDYAE